MDSNLNQLLQWSIENSSAAQPDSSAPPAQSRPLDTAGLEALMGGPSDAELMKQSMLAIQSPDIILSEKLVAFDNLEQLVENIDNANNLESLGLWTPLVELLTDKEGDLRRMAAWCVGTAVQNNPKAQERALVVGSIPALVKMAVEETDGGAKRKAIYALSSEVRNYQPGLDTALKALPEKFKTDVKIDAGDMEGVDTLIDKLRQTKAVE